MREEVRTIGYDVPKDSYRNLEEETRKGPGDLPRPTGRRVRLHIGFLRSVCEWLNGRVNNVVLDIGDIEEAIDGIQQAIADLDARVRALEGGGGE
ncbi:MAG: hypothetical protein QXS54_11525 [Candidatus Methanomethylicaceae archaeon]